MELDLDAAAQAALPSPQAPASQHSEPSLASDEGHEAGALALPEVDAGGLDDLLGSLPTPSEDAGCVCLQTQSLGGGLEA